MKKPQLSLLTASLLVASLLLTSTTSSAATTKQTAVHHKAKHKNKTYKGEKNYKDEAMPCPVELTLLDGLYFGAAAGYDSYRVVDEVGGDGFFIDPVDPRSFRLDPRLNATGAVGGAFVGLGHYFTSLYNTYLGIELFGNGSAATSDYELPINPALGLGDRYSTKVKVKSNYGISFLPGIKLNNATLFYVRLGYNWSNIDVDENFNDANLAFINVDESSTSHGFNYGVGLEGAFCGSWSVRAEYTHTDYTSIETSLGTEISPTSNQFMMGLIFHFI